MMRPLQGWPTIAAIALLAVAIPASTSTQEIPHTLQFQAVLSDDEGPVTGEVDREPTRPCCGARPSD